MGNTTDPLGHVLLMMIAVFLGLLVAMVFTLLVFIVFQQMDLYYIITPLVQQIPLY